MINSSVSSLDILIKMRPERYRRKSLYRVYKIKACEENSAIQIIDKKEKCEKVFVLLHQDPAELSFALEIR